MNEHKTKALYVGNKGKTPNVITAVAIFTKTARLLALVVSQQRLRINRLVLYTNKKVKPKYLK